MSRKLRRGLLDTANGLNALKLDEFGDPEIATRIAQYEMAYRMQMSIPELADFSDEPQSILDLYGPDVQRRGSFAYNCLMARRLAERGVRFVQLMHAGWDQHRNLNSQLAIQCQDTDAPSAALVMDLKQRGLLEDTLVIWTGEFGRTATDQNNGNGRRHNNRGFTTWLAGGGVKGGIRHGATDPVGMESVENKVHIHDLHATVLHLLGLNHEELTYRHSGRDFRLTDVYGNVVNDILA